VSSYDVSFFFLTEFVTFVSRFVSVVSRIRDEVTNEPCIAENKDPPNTPATPSMWNGCIRMFCLEYDHEVESTKIPKGIPSEKEP
jgi:hypothetical protein